MLEAKGVSCEGAIERMEVFSYHLIEAPPTSVFFRLFGATRGRRSLRDVAGLGHAECLLPMRMGRAVSSLARYHLGALVLFAHWEDEASLERFLAAPPHPLFARDGWHVRMRLYRRWGSYAALDGATVYDELAPPAGPVVGLTLARLRLSQTLRFARFGKPVEAQVRDHPGVERATVAFRPLNTFSTFSVWRSEQEMLGMVRGTRAERDGTRHRDAMVERARRPFHYEFTTMRLVPLSEHGRWPAPLERARLPEG